MWPAKARSGLGAKRRDPARPRPVFVTIYGYISSIADGYGGPTIWTANTRDAEGHLTSATFKNGITALTTYDPNTGRETSFANPDDPKEAGKPMVGPIPPDNYYVTNRPTGSLLNRIFAAIAGEFNGTSRSEWFALFSTTTKSDQMSVGGAEASGFTQMAASTSSEGCVTMCSAAGFNPLRQQLLNTQPANIPGTQLREYGTLTVTPTGVH